MPVRAGLRALPQAATLSRGFSSWAPVPPLSCSRSGGAFSRRALAAPLRTRASLPRSFASPLVASSMSLASTLKGPCSPLWSLNSLQCARSQHSAAAVPPSCLVAHGIVGPTGPPRRSPAKGSVRRLVCCRLVASSLARRLAPSTSPRVRFGTAQVRPVPLSIVPSTAQLPQVSPVQVAFAPVRRRCKVLAAAVAILPVRALRSAPFVVCPELPRLLRVSVTDSQAHRRPPIACSPASCPGCPGGPSFVGIRRNGRPFLEGLGAMSVARRVMGGGGSAVRAFIGWRVLCGVHCRWHSAPTAHPPSARHRLGLPLLAPVADLTG